MTSKSQIRAKLQQSHLQSLLGRVAGTVGKSVPYILVEVYLTRVVCTGTDLTTTVIAETALRDGEEVDMGGVVCVPAKKLTALVDVLPDAPIALTVLDNDRLQVECGDYTGIIPCVEVEANFPVFCLPAESAPFGCDGDLLPSLHAACVHAFGKEKSHPLLEGMHLVADNERLTAAATDGHRLAVASKEGLQAYTAKPFPPVTIAPRALAELKKLSVGTLEIHIRDNDVVFSGGGITIISRLLEGEYPSYRKVIPSSHPHCCVVKAAELAAIVERVNVLSESDSVLLDISAGQDDDGDIRVSAESVTGEASDLVAAEVCGEGVVVRVAPRYFLDALRSLAKDSEDVVIKYDTDETVLLLIPVDHSKWDERVEVVMPRRG